MAADVMCAYPNHNKPVVIRVCKWKFRIISRVEMKQGMKQLKDHEVMDPQFLFLLVSNLAGNVAVLDVVCSWF